jgi:hypothetical protein
MGIVSSPFTPFLGLRQSEQRRILQVKQTSAETTLATGTTHSLLYQSFFLQNWTYFELYDIYMFQKLAYLNITFNVLRTEIIFLLTGHERFLANPYLLTMHHNTI